MPRVATDRLHAARATIALLRQAAGVLLETSPDFARLMTGLEPGWSGARARVDPALQTQVCGPREAR